MGIESVFNRVSNPSWVFGGTNVFGSAEAAVGNLDFDTTPAAIGVSGFMGIGIPGANLFAASFALASSIGRMPGGRPPGFPAYFGASPYGQSPPPPAQPGAPAQPPPPAAPPPAAEAAAEGAAEKPKEPEKKEPVKPADPAPAPEPPAPPRRPVDRFAALKWTEAQRNFYTESYVEAIRMFNNQHKSVAKVTPVLLKNGVVKLTVRPLKKLTPDEAATLKAEIGQLMANGTANGLVMTVGKLPESPPAKP